MKKKKQLKKQLYFSFLILAISIGLSFLFFFQTNQKTKAYAQQNTIKIPANVVKDQFIVQYKDGYAPQDIDEKIGRRAEMRKNIFGAISLFFTDLTQKKPEDIKTDLQTFDNKQKITRKGKLFRTGDKSLGGFYVLHIKNQKDLRTIMTNYAQQDFIKTIQPDGIAHGSMTPNDTYYPQQYHLPKIHADQTWDLQQGSKSAVIGVVDTGIDYTNPDLPGDIILGHNYVTGTEDPMDDYGHGTMIAGLIGAVTNNNAGVSGVNLNAQMIAIKVLDASNSGQWSWVDSGIVEAVDKGAKIINLSIGSTTPSTCQPAEQSAIDYATAHDVLVVNSAGNNNADASNYEMSNCTGLLTVGATDSTDSRASFSNFGTSVAISAPGVGMYSTKSSSCNASFCPAPSLVDTYYQTGQGTSFAVPLVVGSAALLLSEDSALTATQLRNYLVNYADPISTDQPIGPRLNIFASMQQLITDFAPTPTPTPTVTPTPIDTATPTPTPTNTPTPTPTPNNIFSISGTVYVDSNSNGGRDTGETGRQNVTVALTGASTATLTTDANGYYTFPNLVAGSYTVTITDPSNYQDTTTNPAVIVLSSIMTQNFGIIPIPTVTPTGPTATPKPTTRPTSTPTAVPTSQPAVATATPTSKPTPTPTKEIIPTDTPAESIVPSQTISTVIATTGSPAGQSNQASSIPVPTLVAVQPALQVVVKTLDNKPADGVTLQLDPGGYKAVTDSQGIATFSKLKKGKYTITANNNKPSKVQKKVTYNGANQVLVLGINKKSDTFPFFYIAIIFLVLALVSAYPLFIREKIRNWRKKPPSTPPSGTAPLPQTGQQPAQSGDTAVAQPNQTTTDTSVQNKPAQSEADQPVQPTTTAAPAGTQTPPSTPTPPASTVSELNPPGGQSTKDQIAAAEEDEQGHK